MGLIYSITRKVFPGRWRGLRPSTLDELIDKTDILWAHDVDLLNLRIVPAVTEELHDDGVGLVRGNPYMLDFLATYSNGEKLHIQEPLPQKEGSSNGAAITEEDLLQYAAFVQKKLQSMGYKNVVVYRPVYHPLGESLQDYEPATLRRD